MKALLEYVRDDARQVHLRVTAALALAGLFVTQLPFSRLRALSVGMTIVLLIALALLLVAALLYFVYVGKVHHARLTIAESLVDGGASAATKGWEPLVWSGLWPAQRWGRVFRAGDLCLGLGVVGLGIVLAALLA